jgi:hypothetical protein
MSASASAPKMQMTGCLSAAEVNAAEDERFEDRRGDGLPASSRPPRDARSGFRPRGAGLDAEREREAPPIP